jgi:hypothetical protein
MAAGALGGITARARAGAPARPLRVVTLSGTPRERGRIHGEELRPWVREVTARWADVLRAAYTREPAAYLADFRAKTRFTPAIERWAPALLDEVRGMAEGSGVGFDTLYALQLLDEEWWFGSSLNAHCSVVALPPRDGRPTVLAQNMDIGGYTDGYQVVLRVKGERHDALVFSFAGFLGLTGLSAAPLGVCCNTVAQLDSSADGLPVAFVVRRVLESSSLAEAEAFLRGVSHASGQSYTIADARGAAAFECSAGGVHRFVPPEDGCVYHTNHPLASPDQAQFRAALARRAAPAPPPPPGTSNSEVRLDAVRARLGAAGTRADAATVREILRSHDSPKHPVCRHRTSDAAVMTIGSLLMTMGAPAELHLAPGPPCATPSERLVV